MTDLILLALFVFVMALALATSWVHILPTPEYRHFLKLQKAKRTWAKMLTEGTEHETQT
jgi:hypothetical protein